jgi:hypothetical protein
VTRRRRSPSAVKPFNPWRTLVRATRKIVRAEMCLVERWPGMAEVVAVVSDAAIARLSRAYFAQERP